MSTEENCTTKITCENLKYYRNKTKSAFCNRLDQWVSEKYCGFCHIMGYDKKCLKEVALVNSL